MTDKAPIHDLPDGYTEQRHAVATETRTLLMLNALSIVPFVLAFILLDRYWRLVESVRGTVPPGFNVPWFLGILSLILVIPLHEWLHGLAIRWTGHRVRYGAKLDKGVFFATADGAFFRRNEFIVVALAPLVGITVVGMLLMLVVPRTLAHYISWAIVINAGSAIGDLWMTWIVLKYPPNALVKDEEDGIRIYELGAAMGSGLP